MESFVDIREVVYKQLEQPISKDCYMVSKRWWDAWSAHVNLNFEHPEEEAPLFPHPGFIDNFPLLSLSLPPLGPLDPAKIKEEFNDWSFMRLKPALEEGRHYVLINMLLWQKLLSLYGGGPEICLQVNEGNPASENAVWRAPYARGFPDKAPIVVNVQTADMNEFCKGLLLSRKMTVKQFVHYSSRFTHTPPNKTEVRKVVSGEKGPEKITIKESEAKKTLEDFGVDDSTTLCVFQEVMSCITQGFAGDGRNGGAAVQPAPLSDQEREKRKMEQARKNKERQYEAQS